MSFKKMLIKSLSIAVISMPLLANAEVNLSKSPDKLYTYNYTNEDSAVKVNGTCTGPFRITPHKNADGTPGRSDTGWVVVKGICGFKSPCKAEIYMSNDCKSNFVTTASLDLDSGVIDVPPATGKYKVASGGLGIVNLYYN
jgi:hypothetical protein